MYWLIENDEQLNVLVNSGYEEAFIEVIPYSYNIHPAINGVSLVYIRPLLANKGYVIGIDHSETLNVNLADLNEWLASLKTLYCRDKKEILHYFPLKALYDINSTAPTYIPSKTKTHDFYYYKHKDEKELNKVIPVVKHYEMCENIFLELKNNINKEKTKYDEFFNNKVSLVFNYLERGGIQVHVPTFEQFFHKLDGERVYSQYNLRTTTTRPSNKFKGVNYAALNKENGCRKSFIPTNDCLLEIDISAYHPSLSCRLVDYSFPTVDIHTHMAKLYGVSYGKSKELTFKQLYGGVFKQYEHLEFFKKISIYVKELWEEFESNGEIKCPISNFVYKKEKLDDMNPQKLFNYLLQNLETSMNVCILWDIIMLLRGKKTQLILYTYDSFLFDLDESETQVIEDIKDIFKKYKFNIKVKQGYDYDFK